MSPCQFLTDKNLLILDDSIKLADYNKVSMFCGKIVTLNDLNYEISDNISVYITGDIAIITRLKNIHKYIVIKELSHNYSNDDVIITINQLPLNYYNVGVYIKNYFENSDDYLTNISSEHQFLKLTESNKPDSAHRTGIYLSNVTQLPDDDDAYRYNLMRCSTNFEGPTDNFRKTDKIILEKLNDISKTFFKNPAEMNHVLAQIYHNHKTDNKTVKAKISKHSDKTKDMPSNGLIAFCTFYKFNKQYDNYVTKNGLSVLTKLRFKLKDSVSDQSLLTKSFDILLYPGSVFLMSLDSNRLYTHEIIPSSADYEDLPLRLGYVVRCSNTEAVYYGENTYIVNKSESIIDKIRNYIFGPHVKLEIPTDDQVKDLKSLYYTENSTDTVMHYKNIFFSLNGGDYMKPVA
jgi:hypothetical protein